jgi:hypothetical protein
LERLGGQPGQLHEILATAHRSPPRAQGGGGAGIWG